MSRKNIGFATVLEKCDDANDSDDQVYAKLESPMQNYHEDVEEDGGRRLAVVLAASFFDRSTARLFTFDFHHASTNHCAVVVGFLSRPPAKTPKKALPAFCNFLTADFFSFWTFPAANLVACVTP